MSRALYLSNMELSSFLTSSFPGQTLAGIRIFDLPKEIDSWTLLMLQKMPNPQPLLQKHPKNINVLGQEGETSSLPSAYHLMTHTWTSSRQWKYINFSELSLQQSRTTNSPQQQSLGLHLSKLKLALLPWDMWRRPSMLLINKTHDLPEMEKLHSFYVVNWKATRTWILQKLLRRPSQFNY